MSAGDDRRWQDWRSNGRRPLRPASKCGDCGAEFWPLIPRQELCHECAWDEVQAHKAPFTAEEIEREETGKKLRAALADDASHMPIPSPMAPSDFAKLSRRAESLAARLQERPQKAPKGAREKGRSAPSEWLPLARKKERAGWAHRKIAAFLGIPRKEVGYWLSLPDRDAEHFLAACEGKLRPGNKEFAGDPRLQWCYSKYESQCNLCKGTIFVGDQMAHVDERWVHVKCATAAGFEIVQLDRRSRVQVKLDRKRQRKGAHAGTP